jgi:protein deglycase
VLVPVAAGSEDIETVTLVDVFRRAGFAVDVAAAGPSRTVTLARGCVLTADTTLDAVHAAASDAAAASSSAYDLIALPGGMPGAEHLRDSPALRALLGAQRAARRPLAAVCAAPAVVLAAHGLLDGGVRATAHANFVARLPAPAGEHERVVVDGGSGAGSVTITSRGPGSTLEFALACVAALAGPAKAAEVAAPMHLPPGALEGVLALFPSPPPPPPPPPAAGKKQ